MKNSRNGYMSSNVAGKSQNEMEGSFHGENHGISSKTQFSWVKPNLKKTSPLAQVISISMGFQPKKSLVMTLWIPYSMDFPWDFLMVDTTSSLKFSSSRNAWDCAGGLSWILWRSLESYGYCKGPFPHLFQYYIYIYIYLLYIYTYIIIHIYT